MSKKSKGKSKSVKSDKTTHTDQELEELDMADLKEVILKEAEGMGDSVVDTPLPANLENDLVFEETMKAHEEEGNLLEAKKKQMHR